MTPAFPRNRRFRPLTLRHLLLLIVAGVVVLIGWILIVPISDSTLISDPRPASSYDEAVQRLQMLQVGEAQALNPVCPTRALTHGQRTRQVVVLFHGYGNCPQQFNELSSLLYGLGYTVLMPRMPHHGLADRLTEDQANLTAEEMITLADESVNIAQGLGDKVILVGFSAGGVLATWVSQQRLDVHATVLVAPSYAVQAIPQSLSSLAIRLLARLPNFWQWWDAEKRENMAGPLHTYPRLSTRALAQILRLSQYVQTQATEVAPPTERLLVVTNANDESVDNRATVQVIEHWRQQGRQVQTYEFPQTQGLGHDLIDPDQPDQQIDFVYPILLGLIKEME